MKKSLVIGGSGFLGSNMIDILIKNGHKVTNFDIKKINGTKKCKFY